MNRVRGIVYFGNCLHCKRYCKLDGDNLCPTCSALVVEQLDMATQVVKKNPEITCEELSENLGISLDRVNGWVRQGKIRCVAFQLDCPTCHRIIVNQLTCPYCGYTPEETPKKEEKTKRRSFLMGAILEGRFSRERKRTTHRLRLLSLLPGNHSENSSDV